MSRADHKQRAGGGDTPAPWLARMLLRGSISGSRLLHDILLWCAVGIGVAMALARLLNSGHVAFSPRAGDAFDFYSGVILVSIMPALGALHLRWISTPAAPAAAA